MKSTKTPLKNCLLIHPTIHGDMRGFFKEVIHPIAFSDIGIHERFVQLNHSRSCKGTLRGLHYQSPPYAQSKLVRAIRGRIYDVAVDIRPKSETFGQAYGVELSDDNHAMLYVPVGFAHGFYAITDADVEYACGDVYAPNFQHAIHWEDPSIHIDWPIGESMPLVSSKDANAPLLADIKKKLFWPTHLPL